MNTVSPFQIIIVLVFLAAMMGLLFIIKRHREPLTRALHAERRAQIISDLRLGMHERLQIIRIDVSDYVLITGKGLQPIFYALPAAQTGDATSLPQLARSHPPQTQARHTQPAQAQPAPTKITGDTAASHAPVSGGH